MARGIQTTCDIHPDRPGTEEEVTLYGRSRVLDLCDPCRILLLEPLAEAMETYGRIRSRVKPVKRYDKGETGRFPCTAPGCTKTYRHKSTLRTHAQDQHRLTLAAMYAAYGDGGASADHPPSAGIYPCPECGKVYSRPQGLGMHRNTQHPKSRRGPTPSKPAR